MKTEKQDAQNCEQMQPVLISSLISYLSRQMNNEESILIQAYSNRVTRETAWNVFRMEQL